MAISTAASDNASRYSTGQRAARYSTGRRAARSNLTGQRAAGQCAQPLRGLAKRAQGAIGAGQQVGDDLAVSSR